MHHWAVTVSCGQGTEAKVKLVETTQLFLTLTHRKRAQTTQNHQRDRTRRKKYHDELRKGFFFMLPDYGIQNYT